MGKTLSFLEKLYVGLLLVVFGGVVVHAPLTVGLSTLWPDAALYIKSWKEIVLGVALLLCVVILTTKKQWGVVHSKLMYGIAAFAALHVALIPFFYTGFNSTVAGLFIDVRFLLYFVLVYVAIKLYPQLFGLFMKVFVFGMLLSMVFAVLQITVLPHDVLRHIGYNESTIMPYLTVDQNTNYVRINGTLRGPNPLGLYATIALVTALVTGLLSGAKKIKLWLVWVLGISATLAVWASYARSAALAAVAAVAMVLLVVYGRVMTRRVWLAIGLGALVLTGSIVTFRDTELVSQVVLHEDPNEGNDVNSNDGHLSSLAEGSRRLVRQPFGAGVGSTGSASLLGDSPIIIENQYLFVAHESGWLGLGLFIGVMYMVLAQAWRRRKERQLALIVCATGVGIAVAGLFLPVWADDTVSIVWWGIAAMALAVPTGVSGGVSHEARKMVRKNTREGSKKEATA